jgi:hypothetical protein
MGFTNKDDNEDTADVVNRNTACTLYMDSTDKDDNDDTADCDCKYRLHTIMCNKDDNEDTMLGIEISPHIIMRFTDKDDNGDTADNVNGNTATTILWVLPTKMTMKTTPML